MIRSTTKMRTYNRGTREMNGANSAQTSGSHATAALSGDKTYSNPFSGFLVSVFPELTPGECNQITLNGHTNTVVANPNAVMDALFSPLQLAKFGNIFRRNSCLYRQINTFDLGIYKRVGNLFEVALNRFLNADFHCLKNFKNSSSLIYSPFKPSLICSIKRSSPNRLFSARVRGLFSGIASRLGAYELGRGVVTAVCMTDKILSDAAKVSKLFFTTIKKITEKFADSKIEAKQKQCRKEKWSGITAPSPVFQRLLIRRGTSVPFDLNLLALFGRSGVRFNRHNLLSGIRFCHNFIVLKNRNVQPLRFSCTDADGKNTAKVKSIPGNILAKFGFFAKHVLQHKKYFGKYFVNSKNIRIFVGELKNANLNSEAKVGGRFVSANLTNSNRLLNRSGSRPKASIEIGKFQVQRSFFYLFIFYLNKCQSQ